MAEIVLGQDKETLKDWMKDGWRFITTVRKSLLGINETTLLYTYKIIFVKEPVESFN